MLAFVALSDGRSPKILDAYIGLPWATFIDKDDCPHVPLELARAHIQSLKLSALKTGKTPRIHTVCQHIFWQRLLPIWQALGITDVHLSHLPEDCLPARHKSGLAFHPWHLYAVNFEDPERRDGLLRKPELHTRKYLASFIGAHGSNYISDVRERLVMHSDEPGCLIEITGTKWHFERIVYDQQVKGLQTSADATEAESIRRYNAVLSDSQFALCPSGTGPNSLRLWEALALGCIPVLLGKRPALPDLSTISPEHTVNFSWDDVLLKVEDADIPNLIQRLRAIPQQERQIRSERCRFVYGLVKAMRCFHSDCIEVSLPATRLASVQRSQPRHLVHLATGGLNHMLRLMSHSINFARRHDLCFVPITTSSKAFQVPFDSVFKLQQTCSLNFKREIDLKVGDVRGLTPFELKDLAVGWQGEQPRTPDGPKHSNYFLKIGATPCRDVPLVLPSTLADFGDIVTTGESSKTDTMGYPQQFFLEFSVVKKVSEHILRAKNSMPSRFIGVHFRNSADKRQNFDVLCAGLERTFQQYDDIQNVFLATDNITSFENLRKVFPNRQFFGLAHIPDLDAAGAKNLHYIKPDRLKNEVGIDKWMQIVEVLTDMFFLAKADAFVPSESELSQTVSWLRANVVACDRFFNVNT